MDPGAEENVEPSEDLENAPGWVRHLIAAVQPPKPHSEARPPRGRTDRRGNIPRRSGSQDRGRRNSPGKGSKGGRTRSSSSGKNRMMGWDNRCYHCGSDKYRRNECKSFDDMMKKANVGKPKPNGSLLKDTKALLVRLEMKPRPRPRR